MPEGESHQVRFRPVPAPENPVASWALERVPNATWDQGLHQAAQLIAASATSQRARITPGATANALARSGYPGHARFAHVLNGGALPESLAEDLQRGALQRNQPVDVAIARRDFGDGLSLWIGAIAHRPALLDPIRRDYPLGEMVPVTLEVTSPGSQADPLSQVPDPVLFVSRPDGPVVAYEIDTGQTRWVDLFHANGEYRFEVVSRTRSTTQVVLAWSHFVGEGPGPMDALPTGLTPQNPIEATEALYSALSVLRRQAGLAPLARFDAFETLAREHAAYMANTGTVDHVLPGISPGVAARAADRFHPRARHREDLAAAATWQEALEITSLSPGHLRNLLCETCTHASVGVALEPVTDRVPRLFVVWEILEFPHGPPQAIPQY